MFRGMRGTGIIVLFLLAGFLFLVTLRESCGQTRPPQPKSIGLDIEPGPGPEASPVGSPDDQGEIKDQDKNKDKDKFQDPVAAEFTRLELVLSRPLIFFVFSSLQEEEFVFDRNR